MSNKNLSKKAVEQDDLSPELSKDDLQTYRRIETWGSALFLAGILLIAREIAHLRSETEFPRWPDLLPAAIGIYASIFLMEVNKRGRSARKKLHKGEGFDKRGRLGWLFAFMPIGLGAVVSIALWQLPQMGR